MDEKRQERQNRLKEQRMAREQKRLEQQQKRSEKENEMPKMNIDLEGSQIQSSRNLPNPQINGHEGTCTIIHDSYDNNNVHSQFYFSL